MIVQVGHLIGPGDAFPVQGFEIQRRHTFRRDHLHPTAGDGVDDAEILRFSGNDFRGAHREAFRADQIGRLRLVRDASIPEAIGIAPENQEAEHPQQGRLLRKPSRLDDIALKILVQFVPAFRLEGHVAAEEELVDGRERYLILCHDPISV